MELAIETDPHKGASENEVTDDLNPLLVREIPENETIDNMNTLTLREGPENETVDNMNTLPAMEVPENEDPDLIFEQIPQDKGDEPPRSTLVRNWLAFCVFGFINNFAYVVMFSGATDILNQRATVGLLQVFNIGPTLIIKLLQPWIIHVVPYNVRVFLVVVVQIMSFVLVGVWGTEYLSLALLGVVCASISGGIGEPTFLALTSFYHPSTVAGWSTGTGAAGVGGAFFYLLLTASWGAGMTSSMACKSMSFLPLIMAFAYFLLLTDPSSYSALPQDENTTMIGPQVAKGTYQSPTARLSFKEKLRLLLLLAPYIASLFFVYFSEYTILSGITPSLVFEGKDQYTIYANIYQVGVLISRSSLQCVHIRHVWVMVVLQLVNLLFLLPAAYFQWLPAAWTAYCIILWVGLLGGAVYANTFYAITTAFSDNTREFALTTTSIGDSFGIMLSALVSIPLQHWLCCVHTCPAYPCHPPPTL